MVMRLLLVILLFLVSLMRPLETAADQPKTFGEILSYLARTEQSRNYTPRYTQNCGQFGTSITFGEKKLLPSTGNGRVAGYCNRPQMIVVHTTWGNLHSLQQLYDYYAGGSYDGPGNYRYNAVQFAIDKEGRTWQMTEAYAYGIEEAWGVGNYNDLAINIELIHNGDYDSKYAMPSAQYQALNSLLVSLVNQYEIGKISDENWDFGWPYERTTGVEFRVNVPNGIYGHYQLAPFSRSDPGRGLMRDIKNDMSAHFGKPSCIRNHGGYCTDTPSACNGSKIIDGQSIQFSGTLTSGKGCISPESWCCVPHATTTSTPTPTPDTGYADLHGTAENPFEPPSCVGGGYVCIHQQQIPNGCRQLGSTFTHEPALTCAQGYVCCNANGLTPTPKATIVPTLAVPPPTPTPTPTPIPTRIPTPTPLPTHESSAPLSYPVSTPTPITYSCLTQGFQCSWGSCQSGMVSMPSLSCPNGSFCCIKPTPTLIPTPTRVPPTPTPTMYYYLPTPTPTPTPTPRQSTGGGTPLNRRFAL